MRAIAETPFVLRFRTRLPDGATPRPNSAYDPNRQLWVNTETGTPLVTEFESHRRAAMQASEFGETVITETREGHDQSEGVVASDFGETIHTRSREGHDQTEGQFASDFGETLQTATGEGHDQSEGVFTSDFGETILTKTSEGTDQNEGGRWAE